jgi:MFS family permease
VTLRTGPATHPGQHLRAALALPPANPSPAPAAVSRAAGLCSSLEVRKWLIVAAATFGMMASFGLAASVAVFLKPFEAEFGWPRADVAYAYALFSAGAALGGLIFGRATDWIDPRPIVLIGALVMGASFVLLAYQDHLAMIQFIYLAAGIFGFACLYTPLAATVGLWFERRRGLAIGIVTAGGTLGQGLMPVLVQPLIEAYGWRQAYLVLGIVYLLLLVPAMWLVTKPPAVAASGADAAARELAAWSLPPAVSVGWLGAAAMFCCASMAVPLVHLVPFFADSGQPMATSGALIMTAMLSASAGRVAFGVISDRLGALNSYALAVFLQSITVYWFVELQSQPALYALAIAFGFGFGGVMTALILSVRDAVPARSAGLATAIVGLLAWGGMGVGGYQGGVCFDLTGSYDASFASAALAGAANLLVLSALALHLRWHRRMADAVSRARRQWLAAAWHVASAGS